MTTDSDSGSCPARLTNPWSSMCASPSTGAGACSSSSASWAYWSPSGSGSPRSTCSPRCAIRSPRRSPTAVVRLWSSRSTTSANTSPRRETSRSSSTTRRTGRTCRDFISSYHVLFIAYGSVDAYVDFSGLSGDAIVVSPDGKSVDITIPEPVLDEPEIDVEKSHVYSVDVGLLEVVKTRGRRRSQQPGSALPAVQGQDPGGRDGDRADRTGQEEHHGHA